MWETSTYSIVTSDAAGFTRADGGATSITPTGASVLSSQWRDGEMWVSQYVFIPEDVDEAIILPAGTSIGTVSLVFLATTNDPALVVVMEAAHEEAEAILKPAEDMRQKAESWKCEVYMQHHGKGRKEC